MRKYCSFTKPTDQGKTSYLNLARSPQSIRFVVVLRDDLWPNEFMKAFQTTHITFVRAIRSRFRMDINHASSHLDEDVRHGWCCCLHYCRCYYHHHHHHRIRGCFLEVFLVCLIVQQHCFLPRRVDFKLIPMPLLLLFLLLLLLSLTKMGISHMLGSFSKESIAWFSSKTHWRGWVCKARWWVEDE